MPEMEIEALSRIKCKVMHTQNNNTNISRIFYGSNYF